jgi:hypothetical protein
VTDEQKVRLGVEQTGAGVTHGTALSVGVEIVVTQAFGPTGENLVGLSDVTFDGHPAVTLLVRADGKEGLVHLSPIHGDDRKVGMVHMPAGTPCEFFCPVSKQPLDLIEQTEDAGYVALYLTPKGKNGSHVLLSNVAGHYHSRIIDDFELISTWARDDG